MDKFENVVELAGRGHQFSVTPEWGMTANHPNRSVRRVLNLSTLPAAFSKQMNHLLTWETRQSKSLERPIRCSRIGIRSSTELAGHTPQTLPARRSAMT
ncbi:hypothetical protein EWH08_03540 [Sphingobium indicum]|uniref:Uncharacterized protein n=1 Tax=Sphingobium indicum TaxID=332055 RepID=A0A4Q4JB49_9SPHN|nr:hypothetical protein [Sphingobium indicum]RYM03582.1 hypothetical protein EWH08_03540 [Sphingobium indicum]